MNSGTNLFAQTLVGHRESNALQHSGMIEDGILDFGTIHILTAAQDHVLGSIDQIDKPVLIDETNITGVQPTIDDGFLGGFRAIQVTLNDRCAADADLTDLTGPQYLALGIDTASFQCGNHRSSALWECQKQIARDVGNDAADFGHAIPLCRLGALSFRSHLTDQIGLHSCATTTHSG